MLYEMNLVFLPEHLWCLCMSRREADWALPQVLHTDRLVFEMKPDQLKWSIRFRAWLADALCSAVQRKTDVLHKPLLPDTKPVLIQYEISVPFSVQGNLPVYYRLYTTVRYYTLRPVCQTIKVFSFNAHSLLLTSNGSLYEVSQPHSIRDLLRLGLL